MTRTARPGRAPCCAVTTRTPLTSDDARFVVATVRIADRRIWVGEESRALLHGEVHYWRLSPSRWHAVLRSVKELGIDIVSSYVCWDFHEVGLDQYDFRGETDAARNLIHFIELAAA